VRYALGLLIALSLATPVAASPSYLAGESCVLKRKLAVSVKRKKRKTVLAKGETVEIVRPGERFTEVKGYDVSGLVATKKLKRACVIPRDRCTLKMDVKVRGTAKQQGKAFLVKKGARVTLMRYCDKWVDLVTGSMTGQSKREGLSKACPKLTAKLKAPPSPPAEAGAAPETPTQPETPEGPTIVVMAFSLAKGASPARAAQYFVQLKSALGARHGSVDVGGHPAGYIAKPRGLKTHLNESREQAREAGARWMITGRLSSKGGDTLTLARIEVETGKVKGINARPTGRSGDPWATTSAQLLLEDVPGRSEVAAAPVAAAPPAAAPAPVAPVAESTPTQPEGAPWFTNTLGYTALGAGALLASGGAVLGTLALVDRAGFDAASQVDDERTLLAQRAVGEAVAADALYASAAVMGTAALLLFITGIDYGTFFGGPAEPPASQAASVGARPPLAAHRMPERR
jgi:hypothetical protein